MPYFASPVLPLAIAVLWTLPHLSVSKPCSSVEYSFLFQKTLLVVHIWSLGLISDNQYAMKTSNMSRIIYVQASGGWLALFIHTLSTKFTIWDTVYYPSRSSESISLSSHGFHRVTSTARQRNFLTIICRLESIRKMFFKSCGLIYLDRCCPPISTTKLNERNLSSEVLPAVW